MESSMPRHHEETVMSRTLPLTLIGFGLKLVISKQQALTPLLGASLLALILVCKKCFALCSTAPKVSPVYLLGLFSCFSVVR